MPECRIRAFCRSRIRVTLLSILPPKQLCYQERTAENAVMTPLTRSQRELAAGTGAVRLRRPRRSVILNRVRPAIHDAVTGRLAVLWADNFVRLKYAKNPVRERTQHGQWTSVAVLPVGDAFAGRWRLLTLDDMRERVDGVAAELCVVDTEFINEVQQLLLTPKVYGELRVPPDLRRRGVRSAPWCPYDILDANVASTRGLLEVLRWAREFRVARDLAALPLLLDVNIFWRVQKLLYSRGFVTSSVQLAVRDLPLVFGAWHGYVHCVKRTFRTFRSWWACLEQHVARHCAILCFPFNPPWFACCSKISSL